MFTSEGEAQEKVFKELMEKLNVIEVGIKEFFPDGSSFTNGENLGLLDILMSATFSPHEAHEEVLGIKILNPEKNPLLFSWVTALKEHPLVKETNPPHDKLVGLLQFIRQNPTVSSD